MLPHPIVQDSLNICGHSMQIVAVTKPANSMTCTL